MTGYDTAGIRAIPYYLPKCQMTGRSISGQGRQQQHCSRKGAVLQPGLDSAQTVEGGMSPEPRHLLLFLWAAKSVLIGMREICFRSGRVQ